MSRTRTRTSTQAGPSSETPSKATTTMPDADPDFLALTTRQQRLIDRTFARATRTRTRKTDEPARKKRRLTPPIDDDMGGFMDDGEGEGGFMDAGGFLPDDDEGGGGGFLPDDDGEDGDRGRDTPENQNTEGDGEPKRIPLRNLPAILSSLNLPSDEDVLAVFRSSASGWTEPDRRTRDKDEEEEAVLIGGGVELKDFRAVCAALMGPDEGDEGEGAEASEDEEDQEDMYQGEGGESSLSEITEDEYQEQEPASTSTSKAKGRGRGTGRSKGKGKKNLEETGPIKLNSRQREIVNDLWGMLKPPTAEGEREARGSHILGRDELRNKIRDLGEMWTEDEITDMVTLFSTQYQGRGLSYDDFGAIMVRAGLA